MQTDAPNSRKFFNFSEGSFKSEEDIALRNAEASIRRKFLRATKRTCFMVYCISNDSMDFRDSCEEYTISPCTEALRDIGEKDDKTSVVRIRKICEEVRAYGQYHCVDLDNVFSCKNTKTLLKAAINES